MRANCILWLFSTVPTLNCSIVVEMDSGLFETSKLLLVACSSSTDIVSRRLGRYRSIEKGESNGESPEQNEECGDHDGEREIDVGELVEVVKCLCQ